MILETLLSELHASLGSTGVALFGVQPEDLCVRRTHALQSIDWEFYPHHSIAECVNGGAHADDTNALYADPMLTAAYYNSITSWLCGYALTGGYQNGIGVVYDSSTTSFISHSDCAAIHFEHTAFSRKFMHSPTHRCQLGRSRDTSAQYRLSIGAINTIDAS